MRLKRHNFQYSLFLLQSKSCFAVPLFSMVGGGGGGGEQVKSVRAMRCEN